MKNILIITGMYLPYPSANGACLDAVLKEFFKKGFFSHVISLSEYENVYNCNYAEVHSLKIEKKESKSIFGKIRNAFFQILNYPLLSSYLLKSAYKKCEDVIKEYDISFVLCVQKPASSGYIGVKIKDKFPNIPVVLYELDSLTDNIDNYESWTRFFSARNECIEKKIYSKLDCILQLESHRLYYTDKRYYKYSSKCCIIDIPLVEKEVYEQSIIVKPQGHYRLVYSGVLYKEMRNPLYMLTLLERVCYSRGDIDTYIYSRGDCDDILVDYEKGSLNNHLFLRGYIPKKELDVIIGNADILVSIGNQFKVPVAALPSKVLYYISTGKPIVHFAFNKEDICIPYLQKYPNAIILYQDQNVEHNASLLNTFIDRLDGSLVDFEEIKRKFATNTASYTASVLTNHLML